MWTRMFRIVFGVGHVHQHFFLPTLFLLPTMHLNFSLSSFFFFIFVQGKWIICWLHSMENVDFFHVYFVQYIRISLYVGDLQFFLVYCYVTCIDGSLTSRHSMLWCLPDSFCCSHFIAFLSYPVFCFLLYKCYFFF